MTSPLQAPPPAFRAPRDPTLPPQVMWRSPLPSQQRAKSMLHARATSTLRDGSYLQLNVNIHRTGAVRWKGERVRARKKYLHDQKLETPRLMRLPQAAPHVSRAPPECTTAPLVCAMQLCDMILKHTSPETRSVFQAPSNLL